MLKGLIQKLKEWPAHYSDGETESKCPWYNLADIFDPCDD